MFLYALNRPSRKANPEFEISMVNLNFETFWLNV